MTTNATQYRLCPHCSKSYYRIDGKCNMCGFDDPRPEESNVSFLDKHKNDVVGKQWSSELHRYLTSKEIKRGIKGK